MSGLALRQCSGPVLRSIAYSKKPARGGLFIQQQLDYTAFIANLRRVMKPISPRPASNMA